MHRAILSLRKLETRTNYGGVKSSLCPCDLAVPKEWLAESSLGEGGVRYPSLSEGCLHL